MKYRFLFSVLSVFVFFSVVLLSPVFAAETAPSASGEKVVRVGTVNIQNAQVVSQNGNTFDISFEMSNREIAQTDVHYGVKLVSKTKAGQVLADEKVYDESLYLPEHTTIRRTITYVAPTTLSGTYSLVVFGGNSNGFSLGISYIKDVTLTAAPQGLEILTSSCYLTVGSEKTHYGLLQNIDISASESLRLTCNTLNHTGGALSLTPMYETRYRSPFGELSSVNGGDTKPIAFTASKTGSFSVLLPKGMTPQMYNLKVVLQGAQTSNSISIKYLIRGLTATVTNLSFDKDYYARGDTAALTLLWASSSSTDTFLRGNNSNVTSGALSAEGSITTDTGKECSAPFTQTLTRSTEGPKVTIPVSITANCVNPHVSVAIKDAAGTVLDQKDFSIPTIKVPEKTGSNPIVLIVILAAILGIVIAIRIKKRHEASASSIGMSTLVLVVGLSFMPLSHASADQYWAGQNQDIEVEVNLNYGTSYTVNDPFAVTGVIDSPTINTVDMRVTAAGIFGQILPVQQVNGGSIFNTLLVPAATSNAGTFSADFKTGVEEEIAPPGGYIGSVFATGPHTHGATYWKKVVYTPEGAIGQIHPQFTVRVKKFGQAVDPYQHTGPVPDDSADEIYVIPESFANTPMPQVVQCTSNCGIPLNGNNYSVVSSVSLNTVSKIIPLSYHVCKYDDAPGIGKYFSPARGFNGSSVIQDEPCGVRYPDADVVR